MVYPFIATYAIQVSNRLVQLVLGFQRMPNFAFFKRLDDAQISQKHFNYSHSMVAGGLEEIS